MTKPNPASKSDCPATLVWRLWAEGLPALYAVSLFAVHVTPCHASRPTWTPR